MIGVDGYSDASYDGIYETCGINPNNKMVTLTYSGCNFKCQYCFWHTLVYNKLPPILISDVINEIEVNAEIHKANAIIITGAEPTQYESLYKIAKVVKEKSDLFVRLDTNGSYPEMIERLLKEKYVDYIVLDIKAPKQKYDLISGVSVNIEDIDRSIELVKSLATMHKFRTTVTKELIDREDIIEIIEWIGLDAQGYAIKNYYGSRDNYAGKNNLTPYTQEELSEMIKGLPDFVHLTPVLTTSGY